MIFNIPNMVTFARILVIPIIAVLLAALDCGCYAAQSRLIAIAAGWLFVAAAVSDLVDGFLARRWGQVSLFGKFVDPLADKLLHMTVMIFLIPLDRIPVWVVAVLLFREMYVTGLRSVAVGEGLVIDAGKLGKQKTVWLNVGLGALIFFDPIWGVDTQAFGMACMGIGLILAVVSGVQYTMRFVDAVRAKGK